MSEHPGYQFFDWLMDFVIGSVLIFSLLAGIAGVLAFVLWQVPDPKWLLMIRMSIGVGLVWSLWSALSEWRKRRADNA